MFNKRTIVDKLKAFQTEFQLEPLNIEVLAGAAMVIRDLRQTAEDIDIGMSTELCERVMASGKFARKIDPYNKDLIWLVGDGFDIRNTLHQCNMTYDWFLIQSIKSLLEMKKNLNRPKDHIDIVILEKEMANKSSLNHNPQVHF